MTRGEREGMGKVTKRVKLRVKLSNNRMGSLCRSFYGNMKKYLFIYDKINVSKLHSLDRLGSAAGLVSRFCVPEQNADTFHAAGAATSPRSHL